MTEENHTMINEFIFTGFTDHPKMKSLLFVVFFTIYLITMMGNLALVDSCCACAITPKMLEYFFSEDRIISLYECMAQFCFLCTIETADCFLLAAMAYDCYVAICSPLRYHTMMSKKLCLQMTTGAYIAGNLNSMIHLGPLFRLTFCVSNGINHIYCAILPLYRLSSVDPYVNELVLFVFSDALEVFTIGSVIVSYMYIVLTISKMKSKEGRSKAFPTCISLFSEGDKGTPAGILFTTVLPVLNRFIYSLRNTAVITILRKILKK
uniref:G-protein coupled receptors family 1 profile domain-containing protein n=1 Tax=Nannospalax galili TaxID=1026970 RepID=A0A8C6RTP5_NANGA